MFSPSCGEWTSPGIPAELESVQHGYPEHSNPISICSQTQPQSIAKSNLRSIAKPKPRICSQTHPQSPQYLAKQKPQSAAKPTLNL
jgi:hypothetical protein